MTPMVHLVCLIFDWSLAETLKVSGLVFVARSVNRDPSGSSGSYLTRCLDPYICYFCGSPCCWIIVVVVVVFLLGPRGVARPRPCGLGNGLVYIVELLSKVFGDRL